MSLEESPAVVLSDPSPSYPLVNDATESPQSYSDSISISPHLETSVCHDGHDNIPAACFSFKLGGFETICNATFPDCSFPPPPTPQKFNVQELLEDVSLIKKFSYKHGGLINTEHSLAPTDPEAKFKLKLGGFESYCKSTANPCSSFPTSPPPSFYDVKKLLLDVDKPKSFSFLYGGLINDLSPSSPISPSDPVEESREFELREVELRELEQALSMISKDLSMRSRELDERERLLGIQAADLSRNLELLRLSKIPPTPPPASLSTPSHPTFFVPTTLSIFILASLTIVYRCVTHRRSMDNRKHRRSSVTEIAHVVGHEILFRHSPTFEHQASAKPPPPQIYTPIPIKQSGSPIPNLMSITPAEVERRFKWPESDDIYSKDEGERGNDDKSEIKGLNVNLDRRIVSELGERESISPEVKVKSVIELPQKRQPTPAKPKPNPKPGKIRANSLPAVAATQLPRKKIKPVTRSATLPPILFDDFLFPGGWDGEEDTEPELVTVERR